MEIAECGTQTLFTTENTESTEEGRARMDFAARNAEFAKIGGKLEGEAVRGR